MKLKEKSDMHAARKIWHIGSGCLVLYFYHSLDVPYERWAKIAFIIGLLSVTFDIARLKIPCFKKVATKFLAPILREEEYNAFTGVPFYAFGCFVTLYFNPGPWATTSIYFLVFADPMASICGIKFGKRKLLGDKTWAGFLGGAVAAILVCFGTTYFLYNLPINPGFIIVSGVGVALIEALSWKIEDNFSIPAFSGFMLTFLAQFFGVVL